MLDAIHVADGQAKELYSSSETIGQPAWLPDGGSLLVPIGLPKEDRILLWTVSYPGGEARRFTNDLSRYGQYLDLTRDGQVLVALERRQVSHIWIAPQGLAAQAKQITFGESRDTGVAPGPAGKLLVLARGNQVELTNPDGSQRTLLLPQSNTVTTFSSCGDRYIVLDSYMGTKVALWRTDADGANPTKLADDGIFPTCTQDGKWIFYSSSESKFMRLSADGGVPTELKTPHQEGPPQPEVSPDGKWIAYRYKEESPLAPIKIAVIPADGGGTPAYLLPFPNQSGGFRWSPDGNGVQYVLTRKGAGNIWEQPLSGAPSRQITNFPSDLIFDFAWSHDGKLLYLARGENTSDAILISNFR